MKKISIILGVVVFAMAMFSNLTVSTDKSDINSITLESISNAYAQQGSENNTGGSGGTYKHYWHSASTIDLFMQNLHPSLL